MDYEQKCFFEDGLRFTCQRCNKCCTGTPGYVYLSEEDIGRLSKGLEISRESFIKTYCRPVRGGYSLIEDERYNCIFWKDGCTVYPHRPYQCRSYPFWAENVRSERAWNEEAKRCPGINVGRLHTKEEILGWINNDPHYHIRLF
ncbi:MAG: YkgJ family cysteine cluster protein [bacterium]